MLEYFVKNASSYGGEIDWLFDLITYMVGFWFLLTFAVLVYLLLKFRYREGVAAKYITGEQHHEKRWIHWPHNIIIAFDVVLIAGAILVWVQIKQTMPPKDDAIRVIGQQWSWAFTHSGPDGKLDTEDDIKTVNDLHVEVNKVYHFELQSRDVLHNFAVPAFRLRQDIIPGRTIAGWFEPTLTGTYDIQCAEMCGHGHGIMGAAITVHTPESYQQTMESIRNGTYESDYLRRLKEAPTPIPGTVKVSDPDSYATLLAKSF